MHARQIQAFFGKDGPQKLIFFHQIEELEVNPGEFQASKSAQKGLFLTDGEHQRARGRFESDLHGLLLSRRSGVSLAAVPCSVPRNRKRGLVSKRFPFCLAQPDCMSARASTGAFLRLLLFSLARARARFHALGPPAVHSCCLTCRRRAALGPAMLARTVS